MFPSKSTSTSATCRTPPCSMNSREARVCAFSCFHGAHQSAPKTIITRDWSEAAAALAALRLLWNIGLETIMTALTGCAKRSRTNSAACARKIGPNRNLLQQRIDQNVGIHLLAVFDFIAATAAAAMHGGGVVQPIG